MSAKSKSSICLTNHCDNNKLVNSCPNLVMNCAKPTLLSASVADLSMGATTNGKNNANICYRRRRTGCSGGGGSSNSFCCDQYQKKLTKRIIKKLKYVQPPVAVSFKPNRKFEQPTIKMTDNTIYKMSYMTGAADTKLTRTQPIYQFNNLCVSDSKMAAETINKLSYPGWFNLRPRSPFRKYDHKIGHDGKISRDTVYKLSFPIQKFEKVEPILPRPHLCTSNEPFSEKTLYKMSYERELMKNYERPKAILPRPHLCIPITSFETNTVNRLSYRAPSNLHEAKRTPILPIENKNMITASKSTNFKTVCNESYQLPGNYIEVIEYVVDSDTDNCTDFLHENSNKKNCDLFA